MINRAFRHLADLQNGQIRPLTKSKFDKKTASNYNHCYATLLTPDQVREINRLKLKKASMKYRSLMRKRLMDKYQQSQTLEYGHEPMGDGQETAG